MPGTVEFPLNDPLGRRAINRNVTCLMGAPSANQRSCEISKKPLGEQASAITSEHDRALALRRTTVAAQIHLSRELVLEVLSTLCESLSEETVASTLEIMGLGDIKLLVHLMRLVASGRAPVGKASKGACGVVTDEVASSGRLGTLRVLGRAVSTLISKQTSSSQLLLELCVKDLMASATGL